MNFHPYTAKKSPYLFISTLILLLFLIVPDFHVFGFGVILLAQYFNRLLNKSNTLAAILVGDVNDRNYTTYYLMVAYISIIILASQFTTWEYVAIIFPFIILEILMIHDENLDYNKMQIATLIPIIGILGAVQFTSIPHTDALYVYMIFLCGLLLKVFIERYLNPVQSFHLITVPAVLIIIPTYALKPDIAYLFIGLIPVTGEAHNHIKLFGINYHDLDKD